MGTLAENAIGQLELALNENGWHPPLHQLVEATTPEQAAWRPPHGGHTVWEIVHHVAYSNENVAARLRGEKPGWDEASNWVRTPDAISREQWAEAVARLRRSGGAFADAVRALDDAALTAPKDGKKPLDVVHQVIHHAAYHAGQIAYLRRLQGEEPLM